MLYKEVELVDGNPVQYVGVHVVRWKSEWGDPSIGFTETDNLEELLQNAYMAGFSQGTAQNIGTTSALEKAQAYIDFILRSQ